ncbi:MAG: hypothetical protein M3384_12575 [Acidobacteriota bacterium]|nr:hypothetical protein [Acidobacteriota bacterium]
MRARKFDAQPDAKSAIPNQLFPEEETYGALSRRHDELADELSPVEKSSLNRFINRRKALKKTFVATIFLAGCLALLFLPKAKPSFNKAEKEEDHCRCEIDMKTANYNFPDLADQYKPPSWWEKLNERDARRFSIFRLSQDFAAELVSPESCAEMIRPLWENLDFRTESKEYMTEILRYAFEGNLEIDWRVQNNAARKWVHAPWMHAGKYGREFIRGLTKERKTCRAELLGSREECTPDERKYQSWAIAFYNSRGAFYLGKVWEEMTRSEAPDAKNFPAEGFPAGSVSLKLIFTQADAAVAPYLENSVEWLADTKRARANGFTADECLTAAGEHNTDRCFDTLRLLQIDVAARDDRSPTGWVFGTFTYNKDARPIFDYAFPSNLNAAETENLQRWLKLEFVGLMFGNDEGVVPGGRLSESVINAQNPVTPHLGCGGRLNGMIDAPASSCFSCHAMAEAPRRLGVQPMPYDEMKCREDEMNKWFRTIDPRDEDATRRTFTASQPGEEIVSLDYSLQLREGIMRYCEANPQKCRAPE